MDTSTVCKGSYALGTACGECVRCQRDRAGLRTGKIKPVAAAAVMASRHEAIDSLDFFPTPPWATRTLVEWVLHQPSHGFRQFIYRTARVWDPCAGEGHMAEVLREYFPDVYASDVHDYGVGYPIGSFVGEGTDISVHPDAENGVDWVIMNPPFNLACDFFDRAWDIANDGVAMLLRANWTETEGRFERVFRSRRPSLIAYFTERVAMRKGEWVPGGSTATAYAWFVWHPGREDTETQAVWIPPGQKKLRTRPADRARWAAKATTFGPLFDEAAS